MNDIAEERVIDAIPERITNALGRIYDCEILRGIIVFTAITIIACLIGYTIFEVLTHYAR